MGRNLLRDLGFILLAFGAAFTLGCSAPPSDIMATVSGDVGPWSVTETHDANSQLAAIVCVADLAVAPTVSDRLVLQWKNKGHRRIEMTMYATDRDQTRRQVVTWTPNEGRQMQEAGTSADNPCAAPQHGESH